MPAAGGDVEILTEPVDDESGHYNPFHIEGHDVVLFEVGLSASIEIRALDLSSGRTTTLVQSGAKPHYTSTGHLVYSTPDQELVAAPFDPARIETNGPAVPLARGVAYSGTRPAEWALSESGTLIYPTGDASSRFQLMWVDRTGASTPIEPSWTFDPGDNNRGFALSPDGSRLAVTILGAVAEDIWIKELPRGPLVRLTVDSAQDVRPRCTRDGRITFISDRGGPPAKIYVRNADGTGSAEVLMEHEGPLWEAVMSGDGEWLVARTGGVTTQTGGRDVLGLRLGEDAEPVPLIVTGFDEKAITLSPDGRWLAYESDETGRNEVYVRPFPDVDARKWAVSVGGGIMPVWSPDGHAVYYVSVEREMVEARITTEPSFAVTEREVHFTVEPDFLIPQNEQYSLYDITPDGERFIMMRLEEGEDAELILVTNWLQEVEARVPR